MALWRGERGRIEERGGEREEKRGEGVLSRMMGCAEQTCNSDVSKRQKKQKAVQSRAEELGPRTADIL